MATEITEAQLLKESHLLVFGYIRQQLEYLGHIPEEINHIIFLFVGIATPITTLNRYGFAEERIYSYESSKTHRRDLERENEKTQQWLDILFKQAKKQNKHNESTATINDEYITVNWHRIAAHKKFKTMIRGGIPCCFRRIVWLNLLQCGQVKQAECNKHASATLYQDLVNSPAPVPYEEAIWKDMNRIFRRHIQFGAMGIEKQDACYPQRITVWSPNDNNAVYPNIKQHPTRSQQAVYNIAKAFSVYAPHIGYGQGMLHLMVFLFMNIGDEEDTFWCFVSIMLSNDDKYRLQGVLKPQLPDMQLRFYQMERSVAAFLPKLHAHFEQHGISSAAMYQGPHWFITVFLATDLNMECLHRIWDIWLHEGYKVVFRFGLAILKHFQSDLLQQEFEGMLQMFRDTNNVDAAELVKTALSFKITHKQFSRMETEYRAIQSKG